MEVGVGVGAGLTVAAGLARDGARQRHQNSDPTRVVDRPDMAKMLHRPKGWIKNFLQWPDHHATWILHQELLYFQSMVKADRNRVTRWSAAVDPETDQWRIIPA